MEPEPGPAEGNPLFLASAGFLAAGVIAALFVLANGSLADAWDDVLPLLFALAALTGLGGWYEQTRSGDDHAEQLEEDHRRQKAELEQAVQERDTELNQERGLRARLQRAHKAEREWARELRDQISRRR